MNVLLDTQVVLWTIYRPSRLNAGILGLGAEPLPITRLHVERAVLLPHLHGDPFDCMLIAQAPAEQMPLVSVENFRRYAVQVIW